jgi:hypothetical protein
MPLLWASAQVGASSGGVGLAKPSGGERRVTCEVATPSLETTSSRRAPGSVVTGNCLKNNSRAPVARFACEFWGTLALDQISVCLAVYHGPMFTILFRLPARYPRRTASNSDTRTQRRHVRLNRRAWGRSRVRAALLPVGQELRFRLFYAGRAPARLKG